MLQYAKDTIAKQIIDPAKNSIFEEHWWFDAACPGSWDVREISRDNRVVASIAFHTYKKLGFNYIGMPDLTRTLSPKIHAQGGKSVTLLQNTTSLLGELIDSLPSFDRLELCLPPETELSLPFNLCGLRSTTTFTFRNAHQPGQTVWQAMEQKTRNTVNAAGRQFGIQMHHDLDRHEALSRQSTKTRTGDKSDYTSIRRIFEACNLRHQTIIITATNDAQQDVASTILVWDDHVLYYWLSARMAGVSNGANSLLIWKALEFAAIMGRTFDLDGYITPQNGLFLAKFGLEPAVRQYVTKATPLWSGLFAIKSLLNNQSGEISYR